MSLTRALAVAAAFGLGGCATVTTAGGERLTIGSGAFRDYVESVFRQQNRVATRLTFALDSDALDDGDYEALAAAEESLLAACADLNALAASRRDGHAPSTAEQLRAARQAPQCERAAARAESVMARLAVGSSRGAAGSRLIGPARAAGGGLSSAETRG